MNHPGLHSHRAVTTGEDRASPCPRHGPYRFSSHLQNRLLLSRDIFLRTHISTQCEKVRGGWPGFLSLGLPASLVPVTTGWWLQESELCCLLSREDCGLQCRWVLVPDRRWSGSLRSQVGWPHWPPPSQVGRTRSVLKSVVT